MTDLGLNLNSDGREVSIKSSFTLCYTSADLEDKTQVVTTKGELLKYFDAKGRQEETSSQAGVINSINNVNA